MHSKCREESGQEILLINGRIGRSLFARNYTDLLILIFMSVRWTLWNCIVPVVCNLYMVPFSHFLFCFLLFLLRLHLLHLEVGRHRSSFDLMPDQESLNFVPTPSFSSVPDCLRVTSAPTYRTPSSTVRTSLALWPQQSAGLMEPLTAPLNLNSAG